MPNLPEHSPTDQFSGADAREVHLLCTRLYDELLTDEESVLLNQWLGQSPSARAMYLEYVALHRGLLTNTGVNQRTEAEMLRTHVTAMVRQEKSGGTAPSPATALAKPLPAGLRPMWRNPATWSIAATILLAASLAVFWTSQGNNTLAVKGENGGVQQDGSAVVLSYVSSSILCRDPSKGFQNGLSVGAGHTLELLEGEIELTYSSGTKLMLIGPAEFLVESAGGKLERGGLVASVTEAGHGFTILTPNGKVVDLGTEFGVAVDDFGVSEVNVFQGKVEAFPSGGEGGGRKTELNKGDGLQWSNEFFLPLTADLRRFTNTVLGRSLGSDKSTESRSVVDRFRAESLDRHKWTSLGATHTSPTGLRMTGDGDAGSRPYLLSADQYDPALGPITVQCEVMFEETAAAGPSSFAILTRSLDSRGVALPPWQGVLASCARCSFEADPESRTGLLSTGVKLESNCEVTSISWSGFLTPKPGVPYQVVMRDDGVNVSFTVSLRDEPSRSKTVTFRSLFHGKAHHIALEGPQAGAVLVDRLEISQDLSATPLASYGEFSSLVINDPKQHERELRLLDRLAPKDSEEVLRDEFDGRKLDKTRWSSLEEVLVLDGSIQLGRHNREGHIDTWKQRPYLLTRHYLDPNEGALTITGRILFAENFLDGYGASFAVMTRADNQHGYGPGWENSVLQRGVRANFWPAAVDLKHTLEIHEKPTANSITLLATKGLEIDPRSRSYLFRVVDDGKSVTLTIIDPRRPEESMTISSPAVSPVNQGFIGFESCWGSPIILDDVRVYKTSNLLKATPKPSNHE